ncbi:MAG: alpha/beta hydrolase [Anaerococcus sp.]|nr:alpha/beta hydrolase [Anaerococcus sp.]
MVYIILIFVIILLVPQIYYARYNRNFRKMVENHKFFKRCDLIKEDGYREYYLTDASGFDIFVREYLPPSPKGLVHIIHGMAEHGGNYEDFARFLREEGYLVVVHDHRGHGRSISSSYPSGYMKSSDELVSDSLLVNEHVRKIYKDLPVYLLGHSMGSMIARLMVASDDKSFDKVFLTGTVAYNKLAPVGYFFFNVLSFYLGEKTPTKLIGLALGSNPDSLDFISYSKKNREIKSKDRLRIFSFTYRYTGVLIDLNRKMVQRKRYKAQNKNLEIYSLTGVDDIITGGARGLKASLEFLKSLGYQKVYSKVYPNMRHEILNEADNYLVYKDIIDLIKNEKTL